MGAGKNIKLLLQEKKLKQKDLCAGIDESQVNVTRWLTESRGIPEEVYPKIAKFLDVSLDVLLGSDIQTTSVKFIPIIGTASCGATEPSSFDSLDKKAYYNGDFWKESLYCVIACGDSMAPEIDDGDEVILDPDVKCETGDMVHYKIGNESAIKVLVVDDDAHIMQFIPYNQSDDFKTRTIRIDDDAFNDLTMHKVVSVNKLKFNNRAARLKMIGR